MGHTALYAILQPDGELFMSEDCVCQDREPLDSNCSDMNHDAGLTQTNGYRVVPLYLNRRGREIAKQRKRNARVNNAKPGATPRE